MPKIAAYADMDLQGDTEGQFEKYLLANGFYRAWKRGEDNIITLPKQSVWKLYEAKDESNEEKKQLFSAMLAEITKLCVTFNEGNDAATGTKTAPVVISNLIILAASPWAGLIDLPAAPAAPKFGGWKDAETEKAYNEFAAKAKGAGLVANDEEAKAIFKLKNGLQ